MKRQEVSKNILIVRHQFAPGVCPSLEKTLSEKLNITLGSDVASPKLVLYVIYAIGMRPSENLDSTVKELEKKYKTRVKVIVLRLGDKEEMHLIAMPDTVDSVQIAFNSEGLADISMTRNAIEKLKVWLC